MRLTLRELLVNLLARLRTGRPSITTGRHVRIYLPRHVRDTRVGDYTYIAKNADIRMADIGRFCSIGPNVLMGYGIHPTDGMSTAPMFYSPLRQNGTTLVRTALVEEKQRIRIGNDVFIGSNVTVLDGVTIGDGAVIGAGAVVSKDIPPFAVAVGCPIRILRYRFTDDQRNRLLRHPWWNLPDERLHEVADHFRDPEGLLKLLEEAEA
ncbi:MAG: CatB-related O-acetyltransferase [Paludibacteraceae bacterium]|nr:CatB-related O-acetyltransferase [Paludibacteraceae bacterium]